MDNNPIYKFMKQNGFTQKDEATFVSEYSNPQKCAELHKFMFDNKFTSRSAEDFYNEYFNPSKKKGATTQPSGQPVQQPGKPSAPSFGQKVVNEALTQEVQVPLKGQQKAPVQKKPYQDIYYKPEELPSETVQATTRAYSRTIPDIEQETKNVETQINRGEIPAPPKNPVLKETWDQNDIDQRVNEKRKELGIKKTVEEERQEVGRKMPYMDLMIDYEDEIDDYIAYGGNGALGLSDEDLEIASGSVFDYKKIQEEGGLAAVLEKKGLSSEKQSIVFDNVMKDYWAYMSKKYPDGYALNFDKYQKLKSKKYLTDNDEQFLSNLESRAFGLYNARIAKQMIGLKTQLDDDSKVLNGINLKKYTEEVGKINKDIEVLNKKSEVGEISDDDYISILRNYREQFKKLEIETGVNDAAREKLARLQETQKALGKQALALNATGQTISNQMKSYPGIMQEYEEQEQNQKLRDEFWSSNPNMLASGAMAGYEAAKGFSDSVAKMFISSAAGIWKAGMQAGPLFFATDKDEYDMTDIGFDAIMNAQTNMISRDYIKENDSTIASIANLAGSGLGSATAFILGGEAALAVKAPTWLGVFLPAYLSQEADIYNELINTGKYNAAEASVVSNALAIPTAAVEIIVPEVPAAKGFGTTLTQSIIKGEAIGQAFKSSVKSYTTQMLKEGGEEGLATVVDYLARNTVNAIGQQKYLEDKFNTKEFQDAVLGGMIVGGVMNKFRKFDKKKSPTSESAEYEIVKRGDDIIKAHTGNETIPTVKAELKKPMETLSGLEAHPNWNNLDEPKKAHVFSITRDIEELESSKIQDPIIKAQIQKLKSEREEILALGTNGVDAKAVGTSTAPQRVMIGGGPTAEQGRELDVLNQKKAEFSTPRVAKLIAEEKISRDQAEAMVGQEWLNTPEGKRREELMAQTQGEQAYFYINEEGDYEIQYNNGRSVIIPKGEGAAEKIRSMGIKTDEGEVSGVVKENQNTLITPTLEKGATVDYNGKNATVNGFKEKDGKVVYVNITTEDGRNLQIREGQVGPGQELLNNLNKLGYDQENQVRVSSEVGVGQEPITTQPIEGTGTETTEAGGVLQAPEEEVAPVSDIEAKKADIERTRKEDLELFEKAIYDGDRWEFPGPTKEKINAKYDAELAALEAKPTTETAPEVKAEEKPTAPVTEETKPTKPTRKERISKLFEEEEQVTPEAEETTVSVEEEKPTKKTGKGGVQKAPTEGKKPSKKAPEIAPAPRRVGSVEATEGDNPIVGAENTLAAAGMNETSLNEWKKANQKDSKKGRIEELAELVRNLMSGKIKFKEYYERAKQIMPSRLMDKVPALTSFKEIVGSIDRNKLEKGIINLNKFIKKGTRVGLRIDIPAFNRFGKNVVTVHEGKGSRSPIGYGSTGSIQNVNFRTSVSTAAKIGAGEDKSAFAMAEGEWLDESPESIQARAQEALNSPEWIQVGMNPTRSSFFFDKADGNPVVAADEVLQVGNLVLAKNPQKIDLNTEEGMAEFEKMFSAKTKEGVTYQYRRTGQGFRQRLSAMFDTEGEQAAEDLARFYEGTGIEIEIVDDVEAQRLGQERNIEGEIEGIFLADKDSGVIYLNRDALKRVGKVLAYHEGIHPVINIIRNTNPELYKKVLDGIRAEAKRNPAIARAIRQVESVKENQNRGAEAIEDETIVEVLARIAAGDIDLNKVDKTVKDNLIRFWNWIAKALRLPTVNPNASTQEFRDFAKKLSTALTEGGKLADVVGAENITEFAPPPSLDIKEKENISNYEEDVPIPGVIRAGQASVEIDRSTNTPIDVYQEKGVKKLPVKTLKQIYDKFNKKVVVINSDPTRVGWLTLPSGKRIFMYGGPGYLSVLDNTKGDVGFATTQESKVKSWKKYVDELFGKKPGVTLIATQAPTAILSNSYALRYVLDAISQLPKSVLESETFKSEFFGNDIALLKDAFGDKKYNEFINKYKNADLSNPKIIDNMISEMSYTVGDNNAPASFKARGAFVANLLGGLGEKSKSQKIEGDKGYYSKKPQKYIASELMNRLGINAEKVIRDIGEPGLVDLYMNEGKWGFAVSGFETDPNMDISSIQNLGVTHPLFNAKFPGKNAFLLDGAYEIDAMFKPIKMTGPKGEPYTKRASLMLAGSMYVKGGVKQGKQTFKYEAVSPSGIGVLPVPTPERITKASENLQAKFRRDGIPLSKQEAIEIVEELASWKDWYEGIAEMVQDNFGEYAADYMMFMFGSAVAADSAGTIGTALNNLERLYAQEEIKGLPIMKRNIYEILSGLPVSSDKISNFIAAGLGDKNAIPVDMHVWSFINSFPETKGPTKKDFDKAKEFVRAVADGLGWDPREVQAAMWAANMLRLGQRPDTYEEYIQKKIDAGLQEQIQGWRDKGYKPVFAVRQTGEKIETVFLQEEKKAEFAPKLEEVKRAISPKGQPSVSIDRSKSDEQPLKKLTGDDVKTGTPVTIRFLKNPEKAPNLGKEFGQDVEPSGNYITQQETDFVPQGWNTGVVSFKKPLVIDITDDTLVQWKRDLSERYGGLTGKKLTDRLKLFGYDGIITRNENDLGEIIAFDNAEQSKSSIKPGQLSVSIDRSEVDYFTKNGKVSFTNIDIPKGFNIVSEQEGWGRLYDQFDRLIMQGDIRDIGKRIKAQYPVGTPKIKDATTLDLYSNIDKFTLKQLGDILQQLDPEGEWSTMAEDVDAQPSQAAADKLETSLLADARKKLSEIVDDMLKADKADEYIGFDIEKDGLGSSEKPKTKLGQLSAQIPRTPSDVRKAMEDSGDAVEQAIASGTDPQTAVDDLIGSQDWYNELTPRQKEQFDEILQDEFGVTPKAPKAKPTGVKAKIQNIVDNYYKLREGSKDEKRAAKAAINEILDADPKLKYIYNNISNINKELQAAGLITDKTDGCP